MGRACWQVSWAGVPWHILSLCFLFWRARIVTSMICGAVVRTKYVHSYQGLRIEPGWQCIRHQRELLNSCILIITLYVCVPMCMRVCIHACTTTCMWSPKDNLQDPDLPFHHGISQAIRFGSSFVSESSHWPSTWTLWFVSSKEAITKKF